MNIISITTKLEEIIKQVSQLTGIIGQDMEVFGNGVSNKVKEYFIKQLSLQTFIDMDEKKLEDTVKNAYAVSVKNVCCNMVSGIENLTSSQSVDVKSNINELIIELSSVIKE